MLPGTAKQAQAELEAICVHVRHAFVGRLARQSVAVLELFGLRNDCLHLCRHRRENLYSMQARHTPLQQKKHSLFAEAVNSKNTWQAGVVSSRLLTLAERRRL